MDQNRARLLKCFAAAFPNLNVDQITGATPTSVRGWDSLATVNLLALIEEEFGVEVHLDAPDAISFDSILAFLGAKKRQAVS